MPQTKITCLLMGDQSLLIQCAEILRSRGHQVTAIVTDDESIRKWARPLSIPVHAHGRDLEQRLAATHYDWFFGIANLHIVPESIWGKAAAGAANFHDGPLPRYAGLNAPSWAILAGEKEHGVTWHALAKGIDEGDIYAQRPVEILPDETALTLNTKCFEAAIETFGEMLDAVESDTLVARAQNLAERTYFGKFDRPEAAATLRFDRPAATLDALVRALDYGPGYGNPLFLPKLRTDAGLFCVTSLSLPEGNGRSESPGTVLALDAGAVIVATADRPVKLDRLVRPCGAEVEAASVLSVGMRLPLLSDAQATRLTAVSAEVVRNESYFERKLERPLPIDLPEVETLADGARGQASSQLNALALELPKGITVDAAAAAVAGYLARAAGQEIFDLAYSDDALQELHAELPGYFATALPLRVDATGAASAAVLTERISAELKELGNRRTYMKDLVARRPGVSRPRYLVGMVFTRQPALRHAIGECAITIVIPAQGEGALVVCDEARFSTRKMEVFVRRMGAALAALAANPQLRIADLALMSAEEQHRVLYDWNRSDAPYDRQACVHTQFERQVDATPDAIALVFENQTLTYRELDVRANRVAHVLLQHGVGPDSLVGLYVPRSLDLVVGALGIQKAGGAYVPLDPSYPADRLALMVQDSGAKVVLSRKDLLDSVPATPGKIVCIDGPDIGTASGSRRQGRVTSGNLAYVIYTSGSTGKPKGVMIEHRNVVNFFTGMDARITRPADLQPVWLAVTSLSFDISVLELFWTLTRGFKVLISSDQDRALVSSGARSNRPMDFGLFYWGNDDGPGPRKYRLLIEGAKFADAHAFQSVWTPERHFHAFGGPYPNPSVTGAAVAAVTQNVHIRAGSCVVPLHHPARVAEEWAVLDNLSNGRVGLSFASGWMPEDFLLRPENAPPNNKSAMIRDIDLVRRLWRGEAVLFPSPSGAAVPVVTQPRPVQKELPVWVTTAGNPDTYREAARLGANVLTHLLGQSMEELAGKIRIYRDTLLAEGRDPAGHHVTLMLHTLVGHDRELVREQARQPMKEYLRSAAALIKQYAWAFPAFKKPAGVEKPMDIDLQSLGAEEMDAILEFAFARYYEDSGLFGTIEDAVARVEQLKAIGVDDIACLIDFGVDNELALASLVPLAEVVRLTGRPDAGTEEGDYSIAAQIVRHGATHLQCTPSMIRMLAMNDEARTAMARVRHFFVGGEALPGTLVAELRKLNSTATVENMYGPTETTIWSSTQHAQPGEGVVPLGKPIANTQLYVLDDRQRPVPPGSAGELYIAGDGVARGYLHRDDLTRERFLPDPFRDGGRMYRTGDLVRFTEEGVLQFLGRVDFQVKVRGYRIELGEIEARLAAHPDVREAVVLAREDTPGDVRLVAYLRFQAKPVDDDELRIHLRISLPDFMLPAHFVAMENFPLTPNAKVDRKALPSPEAGRKLAVAAEYVAPQSDVQRQVAEVYQRVLGLAQVGLTDNFFKLGGHSLLAVQAHRELRTSVSAKLTITDIFRFPTVASLAAHVDNGDKPAEQLALVADRAAARREAMSARRGVRRGGIEK